MPRGKGTGNGPWRHLGLLMTVPMMLLAGPAVGYWIGAWADRRTGQGPFWTVLFIGLGFVAAAKEVYGILKIVQKESDPD